MRRTTRVLAGALMAAGLGLSGCGGDDEVDLDEGVTREQFEEEEVGSPDPVDGGDEDPDGVDRGTGGVDEDDNTVLDQDDPELDEDVPPGQVDDNSVDGEDGTPSTEEGM